MLGEYGGGRKIDLGVVMSFVGFEEAVAVNDECLFLRRCDVGCLAMDDKISPLLAYRVDLGLSYRRESSFRCLHLTTLQT